MNKLSLHGGIAQRLFNTPLLLEEGKANIIYNALAGRFGLQEREIADALVGYRKPDALFDKDEDEETVPEDKQPMDMVGSVAVVPIVGSLVHRFDWVAAESGLTTYEALRSTLAQLAANPQVKGILLDIDSPGGEVEGNFELAQFIREINDNIKPVWAIANGMAFSGAFSLGVAAGLFAVTRTGGVGSVGVIMQHVEFSKQNEQRGIAVTNIIAGKRKADLSSDFPLTDSAKATMQEEIDRLYEIFVAHVAQMRGIDVQVVKNTEAGLIFGAAAANIGFVDGVASFDEVLENLLMEVNSPEKQNVDSINQQVGANMALFGKRKADVQEPEQAQQDAPIVQEQPPIEKEDEEVAPEVIQPAHETVEAPGLNADIAAGIANIAITAGAAHMIPDLLKTCTSIEAAKAVVQGNASGQIKKLCGMAGQGEKAAIFIKQGLSVEQVQQELIGIMASADEAVVTSNKQAPEDVVEDFTMAKDMLVDDAKKRRVQADAKQASKRSA